MVILAMSVMTQLSHICGDTSTKMNRLKVDEDEDVDVVWMKENQGECILGISGGCGGNIRRI